MQKLVAVDAHKRSITTVLFENGKPIGKPKRLPSSPAAFKTLALQHPDAHFAFEACSVQEWMIDVLREGGVTAEAYTPPKKEGKGKKSDPQDALRLGRKVLLEDVNVVRVPPPAERRVRDRVRQRVFLMQERVALINRLKHALNRWGFTPEPPAPQAKTPSILDREGRAQVLRRFPDLEEEYILVDAFETRLKLLDKEMERLGKANPSVQILRTIPGFGPLVALAFQVETGPVARFEKANRLVSYYGLDCVWSQSGDTRVDQHHISRQGRNHMRGLLVQAAWIHVNACPNSDFAKKYHHLVNERGKLKGQAIIAVAQHLVRVAWTLLKENRPFTLNRPAQEGPCRAPETGRRDR